jgi:hypothetical protein
MEYAGPHSDGYTVAEASVYYGGGGTACDAVFAWGDFISKREGEDYLLDGNFRKYSDAARPLFKNIRIDRIKVSR